MPRRPSKQTAAVLVALAREPQISRYGYELGKEVALEAGTLYPILMRLTDRGLLEAGWETDPPAGRPPRHLYRLTADGVRAAAEAAVAPPARRRVRRTALGES
jgi:PadR family transcriptional regulator PadR